MSNNQTNPAINNDILLQLAQVRQRIELQQIEHEQMMRREAERTNQLKQQYEELTNQLRADNEQIRNEMGEMTEATTAIRSNEMFLRRELNNLNHKMEQRAHLLLVRF